MTKLFTYRDVVCSNNSNDNPLFNKNNIKYFKCRNIADANQSGQDLAWKLVCFLTVIQCHILYFKIYFINLKKNFSATNWTPWISEEGVSKVFLPYIKLSLM